MKSLFSRRCSSFTYLNATQFLGALNDNIFKFLIIYFCIDMQGITNSPRILATAGACFVLPFLLLSSTSGTLADRFSKRNIIVATKILEVVVMVCGIIAFSLQSVLGAYSILFIMATQSALFGPSKYGILPEIVGSEKISQANGLLTCMTFLAIIAGTFLASFITDITDRNFVFASFVCTGIAVAGLLASFGIQYTPPSGSTKKINPWFLGELYKTAKIIQQQHGLLITVLGSAYFLFAGAYIQLNIVPFAIQSLHLTDVQGGYLFLLTALGIGAGSFLAGKLSGSSVELGLVPLGGIGMTVGCFLLNLWPDQLAAVIPITMMLGLCGGLFLVPLDTYTQVASPSQLRGQVVATTNFIGFLGVLCASVATYFICEVCGYKAESGFIFLGYLTLAMTLAYIALFYDYLTRYLGMILSHLRFKMTICGQENIASSNPSLFICNHTALNDTLLMLGSQRNRMRFFTARHYEQESWIQRLYRLIKSVKVPSIERIDSDLDHMNLIMQTLKKGISICLLIDESYGDEERNRLIRACQELLANTPYSLIPVSIQKGSKLQKDRPLAQFLKKFRVPASIAFATEPRSFQE